jgi:16S rRNA (guanine966-N2)-methyltransferase
MALSITGGRFNGSVLRTPTGDRTRPTSGKVRQALFNILRGSFEDADFLDLYAGSGAVGLEALSRGCRRAVLVENHPGAYRVLEENCRLLLSRGAEEGSLQWKKQDARAYCKTLGKTGGETGAGPFGVVFADPPFGQDFSGLPELILPLLAEDGVAVVQYPTRNPPAWVAPLTGKARLLEYGESSLAVFGAD